MNELCFIFLVLLAAELAQCFPVTASQGGKGSAQLFFCKIPRCADNVTSIFCNDKPLLGPGRIADCTGPPLPNAVCQHGGRAFVSIDTDGDCDFEWKSVHIESAKCTDYRDICASISAKTSSGVTTRDNAARGYIVGGVCGSALIVILVVVTWCICSSRFAHLCKKGQSRVLNPQPASDPAVTELLNLGETIESDTPGLDDGSSISHCDQGA